MKFIMGTICRELQVSCWFTAAKDAWRAASMKFTL